MPIVTVTAPGRPRYPNGNTFSQTFRWRPSEPGAPRPASVAIVGSLTHWRPVALGQPRADDAWQVILRGIPGNRTHRYVLLVDGQPTADDSCDGLTPPVDANEREYQVVTPHGPRVCLLFSNTK